MLHLAQAAATPQWPGDGDGDVWTPHCHSVHLLLSAAVLVLQMLTTHPQAPPPFALTAFFQAENTITTTMNLHLSQAVG